jgi:uncharacterized repeat protein (TIGR03809 family)
MTHRRDVALGREIVARWCTLAEQRLQYLAELFETGRWRRFHSESAFLENIQEAKAAVEMWRELLRRETAPGDSVVNISWPARTAAPLLRSERLPDQIRRPQPTPITEPRADVSIAAKADLVRSNGALSAPAPYAPVPDPVLELAMGTGSIEQRYPLLRNTM